MFQEEMSGKSLNICGGSKKKTFNFIYDAKQWG